MISGEVLIGRCMSVLFIVEVVVDEEELDDGGCFGTSVTWVGRPMSPGPHSLSCTCAVLDEAGEELANAARYLYP